MSTRVRLNIVDDPLERHGGTPSQPRADADPAGGLRTEAAGTAVAPGNESSRAVSTATHAGVGGPAVAEGPRYSQEVKRAVFGRVPRSLSRRLERAVLELREDTENITQEQVLAALLDRYVDANDADSFRTLVATVDAYRSRL